MPHRICLGKAPTWSAHYVPKTNSTTPSFEHKNRNARGTRGRVIPRAG